MAKQERSYNVVEKDITEKNNLLERVMLKKIISQWTNDINAPHSYRVASLLKIVYPI